jgi:hypothetical protein
MSGERSWSSYLFGGVASAGLNNIADAISVHARATSKVADAAAILVGLYGVYLVTLIVVENIERANDKRSRKG